MQAVLFDLDGTLLDRDASVRMFITRQYERWQEALSIIPKETYVQRFIELDDHGYVWKDVVYQQLIEEFDIKGAAWEELLDDYLKHFQDSCVPFPFLIEMAEGLQSNGWKLGIITNGRDPFQMDNMEAIGIHSYMQEILISESEGVKKPDSAIFKRAARRLGVPVEACVFVGDHPEKDVQAAAKAGMKTVWKKNPLWKTAEADAVITGLEQVPVVLRNLLKKEKADIIQGHCPGLSVHAMERYELGQNNDVYLINGKYVFRFPKYKEGVQKLIQETRVLDHIQGKLPLSIPEPAYRFLDDQEPENAFAGVRWIEGEPLWPEDMERLEESLQKHIAGQLSSFLCRLHNIPTERRTVEKTTAEQIKADLETLYADIQHRLFPFMCGPSTIEVKDTFEAFFEQERFTFSTTLIHGDFGPSNLLWDKKSRQVTGVIDFGETGIGDPAYDFAGLLSGYGEAFVKEALSLYPGGAQMFERAHFYQQTFALQEALYGLDYGDRAAFESGMSRYQ
ncbi:HAD-IA family hydrolase [Halobacillus kuroshimensis]|uniref:HAD-IA family hydrolase n=1 Tax=Halobacillus kuroshimensis TaxID=302481 RepID=UPI00042A35F0